MAETNATAWIQNGSYQIPYTFDTTLVASLLEPLAQLGNLIPALPSLDSDTYIRNYTSHFSDVQKDHLVKNVSGTGTEQLNKFLYRKNTLESCKLQLILRIGEKYAIPELKCAKIDIYNELNKIAIALANELEDACLSFIQQSANTSIKVTQSDFDNDAYSNAILPLTSYIRKAGSNAANVVICIAPNVLPNLMKSEAYMKQSDLSKQEIMRGFVGIIQALPFVVLDRAPDDLIFSIDLTKIQRRFYDWTKLNLAQGNSNDYEMIYCKYLQYYNFIIQGATTVLNLDDGTFSFVPSDDEDSTVWDGKKKVDYHSDETPGRYSSAQGGKIKYSFNYYSFLIDVTPDATKAQ